VRTVRVPDPGDLLAKLPESGALAWVRRGDGLVAWGEAVRISLPAGVDRFTVGEKRLRELFETADTDDRVGLPGCGPVAFGSFTFDAGCDGSVLVVPRALVGRRAGTSWFTTIAANGRDAVPAAAPRAAQVPAQVQWQGGTLSSLQWEQAVTAAVARIRAGELGKVVLARDLHGAASAPINVQTLLARLAARDPDCYTFACAGLIGATPELLIRREGKHVGSRVIAGTIARSTAPAADSALSEALLTSAKDAEEHRYSVESVRDALAPLCDTLDVDAAPSLMLLADVHHLATSISGTLAKNTSALELAGLLHPTAAVCGTPADTAMKLIREFEGMNRGRYAGPVGWVDARGNGEWGIALHCGEITGNHARLFAGCGIAAASEPTAELTEAEAKFRPMQRALQPAAPGTGSG
jgi:menaquinone-specific isochorismate synthase